jgi:hypothetical protein
MGVGTTLCVERENFMSLIFEFVEDAQKHICAEYQYSAVLVIIWVKETFEN